MNKILNLSSLDDPNSIKYTISKFPDGQQTLDIISHEDIKAGDIFTIKSRLNSFLDLELILCATQALRNLYIKDIILYTPAFLGARSDRKFQKGGVNYLKQIICPIINSQKYTTVLVMDPHSDVLEACLNNFDKLNNHLVVKYSLRDLYGENEYKSKTAIVSPDAGALKKIYDVAKEFGIEKVITASKLRDIQSGKILKTEVPVTDWTGIENVIIIDDICDGGRTFTELSKTVKESGFTGKINLIVTHGIFTAGLKPLNEHFDRIFTTNSVIDKNDEGFLIKNEGQLEKLTQFNVL